MKKREEEKVKNIEKARFHFNNLRDISKKNGFSTKVTFRNRDFLYWLLVLSLKRRES